MTRSKVEKKLSKPSLYVPLDQKSTTIKKSQKNKFVKTKKGICGYYASNGSELTDVPYSISKFQVQSDPKNIDYREIFSSLWIKYKPRSTTYIKSGSDWISQLIHEEKEDKPIPLFIRKKLKELAEQIYNDDLAVHKQVQENRNKSEKYFHKAVTSYGTTRDKIASHALQCMDSPVFSLNDLHFLIECVSPKAKYHRVEAIDHLTNLFNTTYLINGHIAREFECHNFTTLIPLIRSNAEQVEKQLVLWHFEDQVRLAYLKFIENMDAVSHDTNQQSKLQGIKGLRSILQNHPNQDSEAVLRKLINKFGDSSKKISGGIAKILSSFQLYQPHLKLTLVSLVEELLYRPNVSFKTQYYGLSFLKDIIFERGDQKIPEKLIKVYFDFFQSCSKSGEVDSRFMSALLRGLNRAYPYIKEGNNFMEEQLSTLYTLCHVVPFNIATQALQLIYQVQSSSEQEITSRFYSLLYAILLDPSYGKSSANGAFLNVVFKTMCKDKNTSRVCAFTRRLMQTCKYLPSHVACGVLYLISEVIKDNPCIPNIDAILMSEKVFFRKAKRRFEDEDDDSEVCSDLDKEHDFKKNNKSGKLDEDEQTTNSSYESQSSYSGSKKYSLSSGTSDESILLKNASKSSSKIKSESSHPDNLQSSFESQDVRIDHYEPGLRNPLFCGADLSHMWELNDLQNHFHPTVSLFASTLSLSKHISYSGDPLEDFTLTRFLDRFIHRNPKKALPEHDKIGNILGSRTQYVPKGVRKLSVLSEQFRLLDKGKVAAEDVFCHNYFTTYRKTNDAVKTKSSDGSSVDDEEFEEYLDRIGQVGDDDDNDDDLDDDFDFAQDIVASKDKKLSASEVDGDDLSEEDEEQDSDSWGGSNDENDEESLVRSCPDEEKLYGYSDEEDADEDDNFVDIKKNRKISPSRKPKKQSKKESSDLMGIESDMDEDEDEFLQLLENEAENDPYAGTSEAVSNSFKSSAQQLKWEKKHREGFNKRKSSGKMSTKSKKNFGKIKKRN